jgi:hypothetical protein
VQTWKWKCVDLHEDAPKTISTGIDTGTFPSAATQLGKFGSEPIAKEHPVC